MDIIIELAYSAQFAIALLQCMFGIVLTSKCPYISLISTGSGFIILTALFLYCKYNIISCPDLEYNEKFKHYSIKHISVFLLICYISLEIAIIIIGQLMPQHCNSDFINILTVSAGLQILFILLIIIVALLSQ